MSAHVVMTGQQIRDLRTKFDLSQVQMAQLVHMKISPPRGGTGREQSMSMGRYENDRGTLPPAESELLLSKLSLLADGIATFEELVRIPLHELMARRFKTARKIPPPNKRS